MHVHVARLRREDSGRSGCRRLGSRRRLLGLLLARGSYQLLGILTREGIVILQHADQFFIESRHHGLNRHAVFGRSFDHAHVAQAYQRHVQGAGNGRGRHSQHVDLPAHLLQSLLMANAEALLFVDY